MVKRAAWLSVTPEPERELPAAVATLAARGLASPGLVESERRRIERLVLRGSQRRWLAYLHEVVELLRRSLAEQEPADPGAAAEIELARARATAVISNHHNLLLGLGGRAAAQTAEDRRALEGLMHEGLTHEGLTHG